MKISISHELRIIYTNYGTFKDHSVLYSENNNVEMESNFLLNLNFQIFFKIGENPVSLTVKL